MLEMSKMIKISVQSKNIQYYNTVEKSLSLTIKC